MKDSSLPQGLPPTLQNPDFENTYKQDHPGLKSIGTRILQPFRHTQALLSPQRFLEFFRSAVLD